MTINLPFTFPMITHVPFDNAVLGILQNYNSTYDWIYSHFINIYIEKNSRADYFFPKFLWNTCPYLDVYILPYILIKRNFYSFSNFLGICLKEQFYVYTLVNMKHIHKYRLNENADHNPIITGINTEENFVKMYDFFNDGIYESYDCPFDEINLAFDTLHKCEGFNSSSNPNNYLNNNAQIILIKYNSSRTFKFNKQDFRQQILKYINSINLLEGINKPKFFEDNLSDSYYWGIDCWDYIEKEPFARRHFSLLLAHSVMWLNRYKYFTHKGYIKPSNILNDSLLELQYIAKLVLNIYLKSMQESDSNTQKYRSKILLLIDKFKILEHKVCDIFLQI